jgi:hypothetical protein
VGEFNLTDEQLGGGLLNVPKITISFLAREKLIVGNPKAASACFVSYSTHLRIVKTMT